MSVDAGIPAYRLNPQTNDGTSQGLLGALNPMLFTTAPELAWGRAGHQLSMFRQTRPHRGYEVLLDWSRRVPLGSFVITSNVDGLFACAGFPEERILEGHGSIHFMQCTRACTPDVWSAADYVPRINGGGE